MSPACRICLADTGDAQLEHPRCARSLFGVDRVPTLDLELAKLHTVALATVGHTALSGVQKKISVGLTVDRGALRVRVERGEFIVKPQAGTYPSLPENEHLTMRIAERAGLTIPACGLFPLKDGTLAYVVRRFDRPEGGGKLAQEDFCQLAELPPKEKYAGSYEQCGKLVLRYATEPLIEVLRLFRQVVCGAWCGNGDLHRKNLALLRGPDGTYRLSPAYDFLSTRLVIPDDGLALSVAGKKKGVTRKHWLSLAAAYRIPQRAAERVLSDIAGATPDAQGLVARSALPENQKRTYRALLARNAELLG